MILKILIIDTFIITVFMYLVLLGSSQCKTIEEREMEDVEQMKQLNNGRRQNNDK